MFGNIKGHYEYRNEFIYIVSNRFLDILEWVDNNCGTYGTDWEYSTNYNMVEFNINSPTFYLNAVFCFKNIKIDTLFKLRWSGNNSL